MLLLLSSRLWIDVAAIAASPVAQLRALFVALAQADTRCRSFGSVLHPPWTAWIEYRHASLAASPEFEARVRTGGSVSRKRPRNFLVTEIGLTIAKSGLKIREELEAVKTFRTAVLQQMQWKSFEREHADAFANEQGVLRRSRSNIRFKLSDGSWS